MGMVLWEGGLGWMVLGGGDGVMDNNSEPTNIFRSDFWDYFLLCPLSPISSFSYLNSMYIYMCTSPSSPLAPSDVSSPHVVMATSSSITVTGGGAPQPACWGSPDHDQCAGTTDDTSDVVTGLQPVTTYLVYIYIHVAASTVGGQGVGPPAAVSTLEFGKQEIDGHPLYRYHLVLPPSPQNYHTHLQLTNTHRAPIGVQSPVVVSEGTHFLHLEWLPPAQPNGVITLYNLYVGSVLSFSGLNTSGHSGIQWSQPSGYSHGPLPCHPLLLQSGGLQCWWLHPEQCKQCDHHREQSRWGAFPQRHHHHHLCLVMG